MCYGFPVDINSVLFLIYLLQDSFIVPCRYACFLTSIKVNVSHHQCQAHMAHTCVQSALILPRTTHRQTQTHTHTHTQSDTQTHTHTHTHSDSTHTHTPTHSLTHTTLVTGTRMNSIT